MTPYNEYNDIDNILLWIWMSYSECKIIILQIENILCSNHNSIFIFLICKKEKYNAYTSYTIYWTQSLLWDHIPNKVIQYDITVYADVNIIIQWTQIYCMILQWTQSGANEYCGHKTTFQILLIKESQCKGLQENVQYNTWQKRN